MRIEMRGIDAVRPYPGNPRKNEGAVATVAASLKEFGFRQPIVVDTEGVVIVGHTRLQAAISLGMTEVPVHVAEGLTAAQARAYRLMDNRSAENAEWDEQLLGLELAGLEETGADLALTGFDDGELARLLALVDPEPKDPDAAPDVPAMARSRVGDLWILGRHRLLCGDATSAAAVAQATGGG